jgi:hypothetical protein
VKYHVCSRLLHRNVDPAQRCGFSNRLHMPCALVMQSRVRDSRLQGPNVERLCHSQIYSFTTTSRRSTGHQSTRPLCCFPPTLHVSRMHCISQTSFFFLPHSREPALRCFGAHVFYQSISHNPRALSFARSSHLYVVTSLKHETPQVSATYSK